MADDRRYSPIEFQGGGQTYRAGTVSNTSISNEQGSGSVGGIVGSGFHDIGYVKELFRIMRIQVETLVATLETDLNDYAYIVEEDDEKTNYALEYIGQSLGISLSSYVHLRLYKYLLKYGDSNSSDYIINLYEQKMRNASGSVSLDLLKLVLFISNEMTRMEEFIDEFIGELDDTSEFRIIESFQNWGEDTYNTITNIVKATKKENRTELPGTELGKLNRSQAAGTQALFKVKLNALNLRVTSVYGEMYRDLSSTADVFYRNYLGRALRFRLKISKDLGNGLTGAPILQQEIANTVASLDANFSVHLADLIKRVSNFKENTIEALGIINVRDSYMYYISQLAAKGTAIKKEFTTATIPAEELAVIEDVNLVKDFRSIKDYQASFINSHSQLEGLEEDGAHPQYLLRSGGLITGDVLMGEDVRIGGIVPSKHKHNGLDGSAKIAGGDIEYNSITDSNIDTSASPTGIPFNLSVASAVPIVGPTGLSSTTLQLSFYITDDNVSGYEFEITEL